MAAPLALTEQSSDRPPRRMGCIDRNDQALLAGEQRSGIACQESAGNAAHRREAVHWERTKVEQVRSMH